MSFNFDVQIQIGSASPGNLRLALVNSIHALRDELDFYIYHFH
jgi:hypothetical protein